MTIKLGILAELQISFICL